MTEEHHLPADGSSWADGIPAEPEAVAVYPLTIAGECDRLEALWHWLKARCRVMLPRLTPAMIVQRWISGSVMSFL